MAIPTDIAGLYAWYKASSLSLSEGDEVATWTDSSGNGRTMTGATGGASKPKFRTNLIAGYPAVELGTTVGSGYFTCVGFGWLTALASHTVFIVWRPRAAGDGGIVTAVGGGNLSEAILRPSANVIRKRWTNTVPTLFTADATLNDLEWHYACGFQNGTTQIGISVDGGTETTTALSGTRSASVTNDARMGQDGSTYCDGWLAEAIIYSSSLSGGDKTLINAYLRDKFFSSAPGQNEQIRDTISRRLWMLRRAPGILEVEVPLSFLDADILDRIAVEAEFGPAPSAAGWGGKKWQRRAFTIQRQEWNIGARTVKLTLLDRRPLDCLLWDTGCTDERNSSARQGGVARLRKGLGFTFSRQSNAWPVNPADSTAVTYCANNERAISQTGELLEEARTNECLRSSFASGTTGLTLAGTGTNGSAIAVDTADLFFDQATTPNSLKFTAGSPHAAELRATFPATASWATTPARVTIDHKTDNGEGLYWRLQRSGDSNYWNDSTGAWGAGSVDNACATSTSRNPSNRTISKSVTMDATSRTLTLSVFLQSGGTASRVSHLYHVQVEKGTYPSSRIVTDAAAVTRVKTQLSHDVTTALKDYDPALGAVWCQVTPNWSSSELGSTEDMYLYYMETNGGADHDALFYDASAGAWVFERKVGGSTYTASKTASVTRGTTYSIGCRWTGVEAELDLPAYTISVFVDGVKGTDATSAAPTFTSPETLYRGSDSSFAKQANGQVREWRIFPYAPTDEEIARLP